MKIGSIIELKRAPGEYAVIRLLYADVEGGVRLDRELDGFFSWNVKDLRIVTLPASHPIREQAKAIKAEAEEAATNG